MINFRNDEKTTIVLIRRNTLCHFLTLLVLIALIAPFESFWALHRGLEIIVFVSMVVFAFSFMVKMICPHCGVRIRYNSTLVLNAIDGKMTCRNCGEKIS